MAKKPIRKGRGATRNIITTVLDGMGDDLCDGYPADGGLGSDIHLRGSKVGKQPESFL